MFERQELIDECFREKRWPELAALVRYVERDIPVDLALTDPALYRTLRDQITRFHLLGGAAFDLERLEEMAASQSAVGSPRP